MGGQEKPFLELRGRPLLEYAIAPFLEMEEVVAVRVALSAAAYAEVPAWLRVLEPRVVCVCGGDTRSDSVRAALQALPDEVALVIVHDAARPLVTDEIIRRCLAEAAQGHGGVAAIPMVDTVKRVNPDESIVETVDRSVLRCAQTPQAFPRAMLEKAYSGLDPNASPTDDAAIVERDGGRVVMVEGSVANLKITTPHDLVVAEALMRP